MKPMSPSDARATASLRRLFGGWHWVIAIAIYFAAHRSCW